MQQDSRLLLSCRESVFWRSLLPITRRKIFSIVVANTASPLTRGHGAKVALVDKGYCGTSGCAAASGNGVWYIPPDSEAREAAMVSREALGGFLSNRDWMQQVLNQTYTNVNLLGEWGYPFPVDEEGKPYRRSLQGPEYMRLMRKQIKRAGVTILDHSPALQLLIDAEGAVAGATGVNRQKSEKWVVRAGAVIIATKCFFEQSTWLQCVDRGWIPHGSRSRC